MRERGLYKGELPILVLFATVGMMLLVSAGNLTMVYVGLELLALGSYALVAIDRDNPLSSEAAMKYFVLGSLASGLLLRSEEHTSELQSLMRISYAVFCLKKKKNIRTSINELII